MRRMQVESIYEKWVPIPHSGADTETQAFLDEVRDLVLAAVRTVEDQVKDGLGAKEQNGAEREKLTLDAAE